MAHPKAKVRIYTVQLVCRKCGDIICVDLGGDYDEEQSEWNECEFPPDVVVCGECGKKHASPDLSRIIGKVMGVRR
jgi:ribosomal protein S27E